MANGWGGARPGAGRPPNKAKAERRRLALLLYAVVSAEDLEAIYKKLVDDAKAGDHAARTLLLDRLLGKPVQALEHEIEAPADGPDLEGFTAEESAAILQLALRTAARRNGNGEPA